MPVMPTIHFSIMTFSLDLLKLFSSLSMILLITFSMLHRRRCQCVVMMTQLHNIFSSSSPFGSSTSVTRKCNTLHNMFTNSLKIISWNDRAVFAASPKWRRPKHDLLWKLIFNNDILLLQEVHGSESDLLLLLDRLLTSHFMLYSFSGRRDTGGVLI